MRRIYLLQNIAFNNKSYNSYCFHSNCRERGVSFAFVKYGSGQKIKEVDLIKLQALNLNLVNKQRLEHANQLHYRISKSTLYVKTNFYIGMPDISPSGVSLCEVAILICLDAHLSQTCCVNFWFGRDLIAFYCGFSG
jgi:hypothetical protein